MVSKRIYAAWFGVHFFLITAVCFAGVFSLIAEGATILPSALNNGARKAELVAAWPLGKQAAASSPVRRGIATYLHAAGIQAGYTFFAPNIPSYHKLILELHYQDGRVEYDSPHVSGKAAAPCGRSEMVLSLCHPKGPGDESRDAAFRGRIHA